MFFSGFALKDEQHFFSEILEESPYVISGFSYGAIKAFEAAEASTKRVDKLQLISPAFFQSRDKKFKRLQMMGYKKSADLYLEKFTENCFLPYAPQALSYTDHKSEELEELLYYEWSIERLQALRSRGIEIEVYLGGADEISDVVSAYDFFLSVATVTLIKNTNHFLQGKQI